MRRRNFKKSDIVINIIGVLAIIILIAILTKFMTNRKEATTVASEDVNSNSSANVITNNTDKKANDVDSNTWAINTNTSANTTSKETENKTAEKEENKTNTQSQNTTKNTTTNTTKETPKENKTNTDTSGSSKKESSSSNEFAGVIWLTFDDGPSANITPKVLDILKKENIKATFFVINYSSSNEHLVKRAVEEGHTIGIHGYSHEYSKIYKSKETFMNNVYTLQDRIQKSTGVKTMYTRFPGGSSNTVSKKYCKGIMTELTKEMLAKGFKYYDWNISSGDAGGAKTAKDVYNNVTKNLSKKRGNMVLMHDFGSNKKGLEALPDIIAYGKKNGYTFAAIDDKTPMYAQHVNN